MQKTLHQISHYPLDAEGFAQSFDPVTEASQFLSCWKQYGVVVGRSIVSKEVCDHTIHQIEHFLKKLSGNQFDLYDPSSYSCIPTDHLGIPILSRGFLELYHDDLLAQLRQSKRAYVHHQLIWETENLWTTFDRLGIKLPTGETQQGLPLHVDQNPLIHPNFTTVQGVLALVDCPIEQGTLLIVPGSKERFAQYTNASAQHDPKYRGEYVEAGWDPQFLQSLQDDVQSIPIRAGDLVTWDSRTTHANSPNLTSSPRIVAYLSAAPRSQKKELVQERKLAFLQGYGKNIRDAKMHASKPPRYTPTPQMRALRSQEQLTPLGKQLYGFFDETIT